MAETQGDATGLSISSLSMQEDETIEKSNEEKEKKDDQLGSSQDHTTSEPSTSIKQAEKTTPSTNTIVPRSGRNIPKNRKKDKIALAPGHSLMDWIRLGSSGVDLTGVEGRLLTITPTELAKHNTQSDGWIAIRGTVFNVTRYLDFHPGGVAELMRGVGKDATKLFDDEHAWVNYQSILKKCVVGRLERCLVDID